MATLYLRNVPDDVMRRLRLLAERGGTSLNTVAVQELAEVSRRADNAALLGTLPNLGVGGKTILEDLDDERAAR